MERERRYKYVLVAPESMSQFLKKGELHLRIVNGLPKDAKLVAVFCDSFDYVLRFVFYHPDWPEVPLGEEIPSFGDVVVKNLCGEER